MCGKGKEWSTIRSNSAESSVKSEVMPDHHRATGEAERDTG